MSDDFWADLKKFFQAVGFYVLGLFVFDLICFFAYQSPPFPEIFAAISLPVAKYLLDHPLVWYLLPAFPLLHWLSKMSWERWRQGWDSYADQGFALTLKFIFLAALLPLGVELAPGERMEMLLELVYGLALVIQPGDWLRRFLGTVRK